VVRYVPRRQAAKLESTIPNVGTPDPVETPDQANRMAAFGCATFKS